MRPLPEPLQRKLRARGQGLIILVLRFGAFGDILRTLPAVRVVRRELPASRIIWVMDERWLPALLDHPDLDELVPLPRARWDRALRTPVCWPELLSDVRAWLRAIREREAELVLDFHGNLRSGIAGWRSGAPVRLGYAGHQQKEGNRRFTTHRVPAGPRRVSRVERNLALVRVLGLAVEPFPDGGLPIAGASRERARQLVAERSGDATSYAVLSPGASRKQIYKRPPSALLAIAARHLRSRGLAPLVTWGPGEQESASQVVEAAGGAAVLAPPTDLGVLAALVSEARLFVGGDTGPLHLACAVGCPVVGVYGPTDPVVNAPWGVPFRVVHRLDATYTGVKRRDRSRCGFEGIDPEQLTRAVDELLGAQH